METRVDEIAAGVYRLSTAVEDIPGGFTFNQFLVEADEPFLFHTGLRSMFPVVSEAVGRILPLSRLRWISFGHFEADECGAMNRWLDAAPGATVLSGALATMISVQDQADRPPRPVQDGEVVDLGDKRVRFLATPHVPHGWDAQLAFEETGSTLLAGDLFTQGGVPPALGGDEILEASLSAEEAFRYTAPTPLYGPTVRRLAELSPTTLACMHGSSYQGDGGAMLRALADAYEQRFLPA